MIEDAANATLKPWLVVTAGAVALVLAAMLISWWGGLLRPPGEAPPTGFVAQGLPDRGEWHLLYETQPSGHGIWQIEPAAGVVCYGWSPSARSGWAHRRSLGCVRGKP